MAAVTSMCQHDALSLPNKKLGMNVKTAKLIYNECKITLRRVLRCSRNEEARKLYEMTTMKNLNSDNIANKAFSQDLPNNKIKDKCKSILNKEITESVWDISWAEKNNVS